jgi:uracil-DNA glycosylase family 4
MSGNRPATQEARTLAALLAWYAEMGVDAALGEESVDWLARGPQAPPGASFAWPVASAAAAAAAVGTGRNDPASAAQPSVPPPATARGGSALGSGPGSAPGSVRAPARAASTPSPARPPSTGAANATVVSASPAVADARASARAAATLPALRSALERFEGCALKARAKSLCFYRGAERARLVVIGEAPGQEEDRTGKPFVGPAGQLLDRMLAAIGLGEADVHITNAVYWRPPANRTPTLEETEACRPFLERQLELVAPEVVLLLGGAALKQMTGTLDGIMKARGKWRTLVVGGREVATMATLHPAYLLRSPIAKRVVWRDLLALEARLGRSGGSQPER